MATKTKNTKAQKHKKTHPIQNLYKPVAEWKTKDDPPTAAMISYANTIASGLGVDLDVSKHTKGTLATWILDNKDK